MRDALKFLILGAFSLIQVSAALPGAGFDSLWSDGKAEISLYDGHVMRYGHPRPQQLRITVVKEGFDRDRLVKAAGKPDIEVLKMHAVQTFRTGTYDYNRSWTVFLTSRGRVLKEVAVSTDGCGTSYAEATRPSPSKTHPPLILDLHSYWDGEEHRRFELKGGFQLLDALTASLRLQDLSAPGERPLRVLPSLVRNRMGEPAPVDARLRVDGVTALEVPAGAYRAVPVRVEMGEEVHRYWFDAAPPHVLLRYVSPEQTWELRRTLRLDYWNHKDPGEESLLK